MHSDDDEDNILTAGNGSSISVATLCSWMGMRTGMVEGIRGYLVDTGLFDHSQFEQTQVAKEQPDLLSTDDVFELFTPFATIPQEGPGGVAALSELFRGTYISDALRTFPEGKPVAVRDFLSASSKSSHDPERVYIDYEDLVCQYVGQSRMTDGKFHLEWIGRASSYEHAACQAVPGLEHERFEEFRDIIFTSRITDPNRFLLKERRGDAWFQYGKNGLMTAFHQTRMIELDETGKWVERGAFVLVQLIDYISVPKQQQHELGIPSIVPAQKRTSLLARTIPSQFFDESVLYGYAGADISLEIIAPMPPDLSIPRDLTIEI